MIIYLKSDSASVATSISASSALKKSHYCLAPDIIGDNCGDVTDGTQVVFKPATDVFDCPDVTMKFEYKADGSLIHHCSKKKVCVFEQSGRISSVIVERDMRKS